MYQISRSIYRELEADILEGRQWGEGPTYHECVLRACEAAVHRLATDRHYFARPTRTLFNDVRSYFPMSSQMRVYRIIESHMALATDYVESQARAGVTFDGSPLCCHATTRKGTSCQRVPLPGSKYCPSHKHLEEDFEVAAA